METCSSDSSNILMTYSRVPNAFKFKNKIEYFLIDDGCSETKLPTGDP